MKPSASKYQKIYDEQACLFDQITSLIEEAHSIVVCAHTSPDGDALGSGLALAQVIAAKWPNKEVVNLLADKSPIPAIYQFLPGAQDFVHAADYTADPDLFLMVDLPTPDRLEDAEPIFNRSRKTVTIDHHPSETHYGDVCLSRPEAAATGVLIAEYACHLGVNITPDMANCLLCAIMTDTGRFQYQNADPEAFEIASLLVDAGADPSCISLHVYQSFRLEYLHLEALVMGRIRTFADSKIAYSYATLADFDRTGALREECDGLIDIVRSVAGSEVALFLKESPDGSVRGNLRSKSDLDVSCIARALGGGGHRAAAGFTAQGDIDEVLNQALPKLMALFDGAAANPTTSADKNENLESTS